MFFVFVCFWLVVFVISLHTGNSRTYISVVCFNQKLVIIVILRILLSLVLLMMEMSVKCLIFSCQKILDSVPWYLWLGCFHLCKSNRVFFPQYFGRNHNLWHRSCLLMEQMVYENNPTPALRTRPGSEYEFEPQTGNTQQVQTFPWLYMSYLCVWVCVCARMTEGGSCVLSIC